MKYVSVGLMAGILLSAGICLGQGLTFEAVQPVNRGRIMSVTGVSRQALRQALTLHNLMYSVRALEREAKNVSNTMLMRQVHNAQKAAVEKCSIAKMKDQFQDPEAVWNKMKDEYERRSKEAVVYLNTAEPATDEERAEFERRMASGEMTPDMIEETYATWRIGRDILMDVYQNQDRWGERPVTDKSTTFPLWADQKYQFDQEWDRFYTDMNLFFGVPPQGRPAIGDEKYDYAKAEEVKKAHMEYMALLAASSPAKAAVLPVLFQNPPQAPRPLPPKDEIVLYFTADDPMAQVYPELPEPWQKYAQNQFNDVNPNGEMAQDFKGGLALTDEAKYRQQGNRLTAYAVRSDVADGSDRLESLAMEQADRRISSVKIQLSHFLNDDFFPVDFMDPEVREIVLEKLKIVQQQLIDLAEEEMKSQKDEIEKERQLPGVELEKIEDFEKLKAINPTAFETLQARVPMSGAEQDRALLAALKADLDGRVYLNEANAGEVEKMKNEERARTAFIQTDNSLEQMLAGAASLPINETCTNGGI